MTLKEIIINTATMIGRDDIVKCVNGNVDYQTELLKDNVQTLVKLANLVINELACSFVPMKTVESAQAVDGKIYYTSLSNNPMQIIGIYDKKGNDVLKKITATFALVTDNNVDVEYSYFPKSYVIEQEIGYQEKDVPMRVLCYGLCAEFSLSLGCYKDAVLWHDRYEDALIDFYKPSNGKIKRREW